jgi:AbrB family looped-hinge helix DNA binding protein
LAETVTITSKGQITIPSKLRKKLHIEVGEKLLIFDEGDELRMIPVPKLSELAGVDEILFKGRKPSKELEVTRNEWTDEFQKRFSKK